MMLHRVLGGRSRRGGGRGASWAADALEASRELEHLGAEGVKGGHGRRRWLGFRQPKFVGVQVRQFCVGGGAGGVLRGAPATCRAFAQQKPLPGATSVES